MQTVRRSMRWFAAAMAVVYLSACGGGVDEPADGGGSGGGSAPAPSPSPSPGGDPGRSPPPPPPSSPPPPASPPPPSAPPPSGSPPASPPPGSGTGPITDPGGGSSSLSLTITSVAQRGLRLDWAEVAGATAYRIDLDSDASDGADNFTTGVATVQPTGPAASRSYTFTNLGLTKAMNHKYRVVACTAGVCNGVMGTAPVTGNLADSVVSASESLVETKMARAMSTALRDDSVHVLAVGLPGADNGTGMVMLYERPTNSAVWTSPPKILLGTTGAEFGASVSLSPDGKWLAVGLPGDNAPTALNGVNPVEGTSTVERSGAVQVYRYSPSSSTGWRPVARIKAFNAGKGDAFGAAVAIGNDGKLIVGAPYEDSAAGGDRVYRYRPGVDSEALLNDPSVFGDDQTNAKDRGAVYAYAANGDFYSFEAYVKPLVNAPNATSVFFGAAVAADQSVEHVAVGAPRATFDGKDAGGLQIYNVNWVWPASAQHSSDTAQPWTRVLRGAPANMRASNVAASSSPSRSSPAFQGMGGSLSMSPQGDWLAAGYADANYVMPGNSLEAAGQVFVYRRQGAADWAEFAWPVAYAPKANDRFGISVSIVNDNGPKLLVGASGDGRRDAAGIKRAAELAFEDNSLTEFPQGAGAAYYLVEDPLATQPGMRMVTKARLKAPSPASDQALGQTTAITKDGSEFLLSGQQLNGSRVVFFGY